MFIFKFNNSTMKARNSSLIFFPDPISQISLNYSAQPATGHNETSFTELIKKRAAEISYRRNAMASMQQN
jgi:hypothetical protein